MDVIGLCRVTEAVADFAANILPPEDLADAQRNIEETLMGGFAEADASFKDVVLATRFSRARRENQIGATKGISRGFRNFLASRICKLTERLESLGVRDGHFPKSR